MKSFNFKNVDYGGKHWSLISNKKYLMTYLTPKKCWEKFVNKLKYLLHHLMLKQWTRNPPDRIIDIPNE